MKPTVKSTSATPFNGSARRAQCSHGGGGQTEYHGHGVFDFSSLATKSGTQMYSTKSN